MPLPTRRTTRTIRFAISNRRAGPSRRWRQNEIARVTFQVQIAEMKTSVFLDDALASEVKKTTSLIGEDQDTVLRMAIRAGLPVVASRFQAPHPEGYFAEDYKNWPQERIEFEAAMGQEPQFPER